MLPFIYKNNLGQRDSSRNNFIQIRLKGTAPNNKAIGSKVSLHFNDKVLTRHLQPARGFQSTVTNIIHFGLGQFGNIDSLVVVWPTGKKI